MIAKQKLTTIVAAAFVAVAVAVAVGAMASRDSSKADPTATSVGGSTPAAGATTGPTTGGVKSPGNGHGDHSGSTTAPQAVVDPRQGTDYCDTVRLLGVYSQQSYGLDAKARVVSGKQFDHRLVVIRDTFRQLARQAALPQVAPKTVPAWKKLVGATGKAENTLRAVALNVQSQAMIVELAKLADTTRHQLPIATSGLQDTCGISPSTLGVG